MAGLHSHNIYRRPRRKNLADSAASAYHHWQRKQVTSSTTSAVTQLVQVVFDNHASEANLNAARFCCRVGLEM